MERNIGEVFEYEGKKIQVVENPLNRCSGCYFEGIKCTDIYEERGACLSNDRKDGQGVIFKKYEDAVEEREKSILAEAEDIVNGSRQSDYGDARESFSRIATIASVMTGKELSPEDCCAVMIAVKLVRESFAHKRDNLVDLCGYAELMNRLKGE